MDLLSLSEENMDFRKTKFSIDFCLICSFFLITACSNQIELLTAKSRNEIKPLTLMVYMAADNDLEPHALANLKAMERAVTDNINILVLLDRSELYDETEGNWTDTRLFEVLHDDEGGSVIKSRRLSCSKLGLSAATATELDMASPQVLKSFIEFGKTSYPAEEYALIIWGHGSGWKAFAIDDRTDSYMSVRELGQVLRKQSLSVIGFDTCFGGVLENLYELKDCADFTVASPGVTPGSGWDYTFLLEKLSLQACSSENIARAMCESSACETTAFINEKIKDVFFSFESMVKALSDTVTDSQSQHEMFDILVNSKSFRYTHNPCDVYLDVCSMAEELSEAADLETSSCAAALKKAINDAVLCNNGQHSGIGVYLISTSESGAMASTHPLDYIKDESRNDQQAFIKESEWWAPTKERKSGSLLDKIFYTIY